jgi:hypothetical protein
MGFVSIHSAPVTHPCQPTFSRARDGKEDAFVDLRYS